LAATHLGVFNAELALPSLGGFARLDVHLRVMNVLCFQNAKVAGLGSFTDPVVTTATPTIPGGCTPAPTHPRLTPPYIV